MKKTLRTQRAVTQAAEKKAADALAQSQPTGRALTPDNSRNDSNLGIISASWAALPKSDQSQYWKIAQQLNINEKRTGRQKLNGWSTYVRICSVRLNCNMGMPTSVPAFQKVGGLPPVLMTADLAPATEDVPNASPTLTLMLQSASYTNVCQCFAGPVAVPDQPLTASPNWTYLGHTNGLFTTGTDVSALWTAKLPLPAPGEKVSLKLIPVGDSGLRGSELLVTAVVTAPADAAATTGDDKPAKAAKAPKSGALKIA